MILLTNNEEKYDPNLWEVGHFLYSDNWGNGVLISKVNNLFVINNQYGDFLYHSVNEILNHSWIKLTTEERNKMSYRSYIPLSPSDPSIYSEHEVTMAAEAKCFLSVARVICYIVMSILTAFWVENNNRLGLLVGAGFALVMIVFSSWRIIQHNKIILHARKYGLKKDK